MNYRLIAEQDIAQVIRLLIETPASIAGGSSPEVFRAVCRDACRPQTPPCLIILVAEEAGRIRGYVVAEIGHLAYWRAFARRHPLVTASILWKRLRKRFKPARQPQMTAPALDKGSLATTSPGYETRSWEDEGLHIARILQIGVAATERQRGIGAELYHQLFAVLQPLGVTRVDANIDGHNLPSLRLHQRAGWAVTDRHDHFFATIDI